MDDFFENDFKVIKCTGHGQSTCMLCASNKDVDPVHCTSMMYKVDHVPGIYCGNCVEKLRSIHNLYKFFPFHMIIFVEILRRRGLL